MLSQALDQSFYYSFDNIQYGLLLQALENARAVLKICFQQQCTQLSSCVHMPKWKEVYLLRMQK